MKAMRRLVLCLLVAQLLFASTFSSAITTTVEAGHLFVVEEAVLPGHLITFRYQMHPDYLMTVYIKDRETGIQLQWWRDEETGEFTIPASDRPHVYHLVFDNGNSVLTDKKADFDIRVSPDAEHAMDRARIDPIEAKISALMNKVHHLKGLQQTLRYQQKNHRATVEDANERVLLWSILQVVGFVVMCGGQLIMLKLFLEKKRTV